jgi:hypothetical protein
MARRRIEQLAAKCDAGALAPEERAEYQLFGLGLLTLQHRAKRSVSFAGHNDPVAFRNIQIKPL